MRIEPPVPAEVLAAISAPFQVSPAPLIEVPILQPLNLLLDLAGEALRARLFVVQAAGGDEACLRPDFTVPVARHHLTQGGGRGTYRYEGKAFRASAGPTHRAEEFLQIGLEQFATTSGDLAEADAEIVALAWTACKAGGRKDLSLWLGDVGLLAAFVEALDLSPALAARLVRGAAHPRLLQNEIDRAGRSPPQRPQAGLADLLANKTPAAAAAILQEVWALAGIEPVGGRGPQEIAQRLIRKAEDAKAPALSQVQADTLRAFLAIEDVPREALAAVRTLAGRKSMPMLDRALADWDRRLAQLELLGIADIYLSTAMGHSFDYYDGLTFEVRSAALGAGRAISVGGRYDGLPARLGDNSVVSAVGCMVRPWRAWEAGEA